MAVKLLYDFTCCCLVQATWDDDGQGGGAALADVSSLPGIGQLDNNIQGSLADGWFERAPPTCSPLCR